MTDTTAVKPARRTATARRGVWVSHVAFELVTPHSSEVNALREAVKIGGQATFVEYGQTLNTTTGKVDA